MLVYTLEALVWDDGHLEVSRLGVFGSFERAEQALKEDAQRVRRAGPPEYAVRINEVDGRYVGSYYRRDMGWATVLQADGDTHVTSGVVKMG